MEPAILPGDTIQTMSEDDFDFTRPQEGKASAPFKAASSRFYNSGAAEMLFRQSGREERFSNNQTLFVATYGRSTWKLSLVTRPRQTASAAKGSSSPWKT